MARRPGPLKRARRGRVDKPAKYGGGAARWGKVRGTSVDPTGGRDAGDREGTAVSRRGWALFVALCVIWGVPYLLIRVAVREVEPGTLVFLRTAIGGLVLLPVALSARGGGFAAVRRRWRPLLAFTVAEIGVPWLLLSDAERHLSSSLSGLLIAAVPLVGVVVVRLAGSPERVTATRMAGLGLGLLGVAMLVGLDLGELHAGALVELAVVVLGYAGAPVIMARYLADLPSVPTVAASLLVTAVGYLPYAVLHLPSRVSGEAVGSVLALGLVCTALAFVLFFALIGQVGPARATVITYVNPAVAVLAGVTVLGESFTSGMAVGFPLILVGSVLAARSGRPVGAAAAGAGRVQSMRTGPAAVMNSAAINPLSSAPGGDQSSVTPSSRS
jgi:drug/metabolite transporter (DMT)-like permease